MFAKRRYLAILAVLVLGFVLVAVVMLRSSAVAAPQLHDLIKNGDFEGENMIWPWTTSETYPGRISGVRSWDHETGNHFVCVTVENLGTSAYGVQLRQRRLHIREGRTYSPSFDAFVKEDIKNDGAKFDVKVAQGHVPFAPEQWSATCTVTPGDPPDTSCEDSRGVEVFDFDGRLINDEFGGPMEDEGAEFTFHLGYAENLGDTICFDNIKLEVIDELPQEDPPQESFPVRVNQHGYFVHGPKIATVAFDEPSDPVGWGLVDENNNPVCSGNCGLTEVFEGGTGGTDMSSGDYLHIIDFTGEPLVPGTYRLYAVVEPTQDVIHYSPPFEVRDGIYEDMKYNALAYFYHNRSGEAILADLVGSDWARGAGHQYPIAQPPDPVPSPYDGEVPCFSGGYKDDGTTLDGTVLDGTEWVNCVMTLDESGQQIDGPPMFRGVDDEHPYYVDGRGGWYDAGDHGKYVVNGGISVWTLQNMYEHNPQAFGDGTMNIPENDNGIPDILDEARHELEFMLNMQVPPASTDGRYVVPDGGVSASGLVHHMLHDTLWTDLPYRPDEVLTYPRIGRYYRKDYGERAVYPPSTAATLNLAAVGAQCARIWRHLDDDAVGDDDEFADRCLNAAIAAWDAANRHPDLYAVAGRFNGGGPYDDDDVSDEFHWAAAELWWTTGDPYIGSDHVDVPRIVEITTDLGNDGSGSMTWKDTAALGAISIATAPITSAKNILEYTSMVATKNTARINIMNAARVYVQNAEGSGHGTPFKGYLHVDPGIGRNLELYPWGSNSFVLNNMIVMGLAHDFAADDDPWKPRYLNGMISGMDYLLGRNAMSKSYVSGYGENPLQNPHHRHWAQQTWPRPDNRYPEPPPGAISGGPNSDKTALGDCKTTSAMNLWALCHLAPQKCYVDDIDAFSVNEVTINWNAPFAWVTAYLDENRPEPDLGPGPGPGPIPPPHNDDLTPRYDIRDNPDWPNGFTTDVTITNNTDEPIYGWTVTWTFPGNQDIYEMWGAEYTQTGNAVTVGNPPDWNSVIEPGGSVIFGFNATYSGENKEPTDIVVTPGSNPNPGPTPSPTLNPNPGPTPSPTSNPNPSLSVALTPNGDVCYNVFVTNNGAQPVDWIATFEFPGTVNAESFWNAIFISQNGNQVAIEGVGWNNILQPGQTTHSIGFCPTDPGPNPDPSPSPNPSPNITAWLTPNGDVCKNIWVTNNGSQPVDWVATFDFNGIVGNLWNAVLISQNGNQVTIEGVGWNNILQPGETTHSIGFCPQ
ncbi:MAG: glycoside hydrolase family 9 protein [Anaerolineae bacterium]|nr:glycoside hydrolase family 9 protein [Anaerolineae bacterium]